MIIACLFYMTQRFPQNCKLCVNLLIGTSILNIWNMFRILLQTKVEEPNQLQPAWLTFSTDSTLELYFP